jgi:hypothetical protein
MTQAQKTAKANFKKAIEYRKKTGVSLKEAFAHVYGKKVGAVKKKAAPKRKAAVKKAAPKRKAVKRGAKSKVLQIMKQKGASAKSYDKRHQALPPGIRISKRTGKKYKEVRANRSDKGKLLGIGNITIDQIKRNNESIQRLEKVVLDNKEKIKYSPYKTLFWQNYFKKKNKEIMDYIKTLKQQNTQLKKHI